jgi:hypothetical protein
MASTAGAGVCSTAAVPSGVAGVFVMSVVLGVVVGVVAISAVVVSCGSTVSCGAASWKAVSGGDGCTGAAAWAVTGAAGDQRSPSETGTTGVAEWVYAAGGGKTVGSAVGWTLCSDGAS